MENLNTVDTSSTLNALEQNLSKAFALNDKLEIANAAIELGSFASTHTLEDFQSSAIAALVQLRKNEKTSYNNLKKIEPILSDIFRMALSSHIEEKGCFDFYTRSYGGEVDEFNDEITAKFGFKITGYEHNDTDLELNGHIVGSLKQVFEDVTVNSNFCATFENDSGEGDECYYDTDGFKRLRISNLHINSEQFESVITKLQDFRAALTLSD